MWSVSIVDYYFFTVAKEGVPPEVETNLDWDAGRQPNMHSGVGYKDTKIIGKSTAAPQLKAVLWLKGATLS